MTTDREAQAETLTVNIPAALARELESDSQDFIKNVIERGLRDVRIERALDRYAQGGLSFGATAEQAGISQSELARYAYARGMEPPASPETTSEELEGSSPSP